MNSVYVLGLAIHPPSLNLAHLRLEEMAYHTAKAALDDAGVSRRQLDSVTLGSSDELDGRPISSMLMSAAVGGHETDEIKVTDSGATALCLAYARFLSGESRVGLVASWCKSSKSDIGAVMRLRGDPFYTRPLEIDGLVGDALLAQMLGSEYGITETEVTSRVVGAYARAARNPRGMKHPVPDPDSVSGSAFEALPLRSAHRAPLTDGATALVLATEAFLKSNPECRPLARLAGVGWCSDSYRLDADRLRSLRSARLAWRQALAQTGLRAPDLDVVELDSQTGYHEAAYVRAFGLEGAPGLSPSGGPFSQNPFFCSGLVNAAEAVLQVAGRAGPVQRQGARRAAAHGCHGCAQQGNVVMVFEQAEAPA